MQAGAAPAETVTEGLKNIYMQSILPLEKEFLFNTFHSTQLNVGDFDAKPVVLLIGQYSTGKTSFIRYLVGRDFPGIRIGPEPTTDRFVAISHGGADRTIPGNAAASQKDRPWTGLQNFGVDFLNRFEVAEMSEPVLQEMTFVDTPGILSGEKQRVQRGYDFVKVCRWFAERADKIILLFDAHKLDISDEFKRTIETISPFSSKISVILNKSDMVGQQELIRVYGALMWSIGKIVNTPEVMRVYVGSFWENAKKEHEMIDLFTKEQSDLLDDLRRLPKGSAMSKLNELARRCRMLKVHICVISHIKESMPSMFGQKKKAASLLENMDKVFQEVQAKYQLAVGDFPNLNEFRSKMESLDLAKFPKMGKRTLAVLDDALERKIPALIDQMNSDAEIQKQQVDEGLNPFDERGAGLVAYMDNDMNGWAIPIETRENAAKIFGTLNLDDGRASGGEVKTALLATTVDPGKLRQVWNLSSVDGQASLDKDEFILAIHLCSVVKNGGQLPDILPMQLVPPSKRIGLAHMGVN